MTDLYSYSDENEKGFTNHQILKTILSLVCYDSDDEHCEGVEESNLLAWLGMFIVAQALVGFACNAFYTVGFAFIEEQSQVAMAGVYFGLVRMGSSAGPIAGYVGRG